MVRATRRSARWIRLILIVGTLVVLAGCAKDAPQDSLSPEGPISEKIDNLFMPIAYVAGAVFVLVQGLVIVTVIRHRHRPGRPEPVQVHGNTKLEIGWTALPAVILLGVAIPTINTIFDLSREPTGDPLQVEVYGHLWWWEYVYPDLGVSTANELHIPTDRPVRLSLRSIEPGLPKPPDKEFADGVIHSFWVPKLAGKQDVVPGRVNKLTIEADEPGRFMGQCAEYCNLSHANMRLEVVASEAAEFDAWVADQRKAALKPASGEAAEGYEIFTGKGGCLACHTVGGIEGAVARVGPNLTHLKSRRMFAGAIFENTPENLAKWVADPPAMKPMRPDKGTGMPDQGLSDDEITKVVAYLETLK